MGMGFAPTWLRQVSPPASQNHFNHWSSRQQTSIQFDTGRMSVLSPNQLKGTAYTYNVHI